MLLATGLRVSPGADSVVTLSLRPLKAFSALHDKSQFYTLFCRLPLTTPSAVHKSPLGSMSLLILRIFKTFTLYLTRELKQYPIVFGLHFPLASHLFIVYRSFLIPLQGHAGSPR